MFKLDSTYSVSKKKKISFFLFVFFVLHHTNAHRQTGSKIWTSLSVSSTELTFLYLQDVSSLWVISELARYPASKDK